MNLLVPLNNREHLSSYIAAGATEFYMGFIDEAWSSSHGIYSDINRMSGFGKIANKYTFKEHCAIVTEIKKKNKSVFTTINAAQYSTKEIDYICEKFLPQLKKCDVDGIISSDDTLIKRIIKCGLTVVASTMCGVYNSDIAKYYRELGVSRIILPRDLSLSEIEKIITKVPDIEYEVFLMRNGCCFSDSQCLGLHREKGSMCGLLKNSYKKYFSINKAFSTIHAIEWNDIVYNTFFHNEACGMCAIYDLLKIGIKAGKIVGRADQFQAVLQDILCCKQNIQIAQLAQNRNEYLDNMIFPPNRYIECKQGLSCYYPDIRFN